MTLLVSGRSGRDAGDHVPDGHLRISQLISIAESSYLSTGLWREAALCSYRRFEDVLFFPELGGQSGPQVRKAKAVCQECPVRFECLTFALVTNQPGGIWGGRTTEERVTIRKKIQRAGYRIG